MASRSVGSTRLLISSKNASDLHPRPSGFRAQSALNYRKIIPPALEAILSWRLRRRAALRRLPYSESLQSRREFKVSAKRIRYSRLLRRVFFVWSSRSAAAFDYGRITTAPVRGSESPKSEMKAARYSPAEIISVSEPSRSIDKPIKNGAKA